MSKRKKQRDVVRSKSTNRITKWRNIFFVRAYQLAREGMSDRDIASAIGVKADTFGAWVKRKPTLRKALAEGRLMRVGSAKGTRNPGTFADYVYGKLPPKLQRLWEELEMCSKGKNSLQQVEFILRDHGKRVRQQLFIHALVSQNFNVTRACASVNISRTTFDKWVHTEPEFAELLQQMEIHKRDFYESALVSLVKRGEPSAVLFVNRTINRDRGYNDKSTVDVNVSGTLHHEHAVISVDDLALPLEVRLTIMQALRDKREKSPYGRWRRD